MLKYLDLFLCALLFLKQSESVEYVVRSSSEFGSALMVANPGDSIQLQKAAESADGFLSGYFVPKRNGTKENPITIYANSFEAGLKNNHHLYPVLVLEGNYWTLRGFTISTTAATHGALRIERNFGTIVENLQITSPGYAIEMTSASDVIIRNSKFTSGIIGIKSGGSDSAHSSSRNQIINNEFINSAAFSSNASYNYGIYMFSSERDPNCCGLIEGNRFSWENKPWVYWVFLSGSDYLVRNNTGTKGAAVAKGGFYVGPNDNNNPPTGGLNNTFRFNHCAEVTNGYCIEVGPGVMDSTCIWSDNTYDVALGLSNKVELCDH